MTNLGYKEGETCNRNGCNGTIQFSEETKSDNCSCHISAPCSGCVASRGEYFYCDSCKYESTTDEDCSEYVKLYNELYAKLDRQAIELLSTMQPIGGKIYELRPPFTVHTANGFYLYRGGNETCEDFMADHDYNMLLEKSKTQISKANVCVYVGKYQINYNSIVNGTDDTFTLNEAIYKEVKEAYEIKAQLKEDTDKLKSYRIAKYWDNVFDGFCTDFLTKEEAEMELEKYKRSIYTTYEAIIPQ